MEEQQDINIKVLSYNTLIQKYSYTPTVKNDAGWRSFQWNSRLQQLILKIVSESPDVICLQQIRHVSRYETPNFSEFFKPLSQMGFEGVFARRNIGGQFGQEGLAIFFNKYELYLVESKVLYFNDDTGRHVLALTLRTSSGTIFRVATTHIMYPIEPQKTQRQIKMVQQWEYLHQNGIPCIITGDFNIIKTVVEEYNILKGFNKYFYDTHQKLQCKKGTFSLNLLASNCPGMIPQLMGAKIDYIFASKDFKAITGQVVGKLQDLPTANEPSDHLPITTTFAVVKNKHTFLDDIKKLQQLLQLVHQRNISTDSNFQKFLQIFWLLPKSIQNSIFTLTYKIAVKLGRYQNNLQFGRVAFTNNTTHDQIFFDEEGNEKLINFQPITNQLIPKQYILNILKKIEQRMVTIPELIKKIQVMNIEAFLDIFDQKLDQQICNEVYGEVYRISCIKGLPTHHLDYGRVSFRNIGGWNISNDIRIQALKKLQLP